MTTRSAILGLLLGLGISAGTYYNDFIIRGPSLVMHLFPISVVGAALALLLLGNPLLSLLGRRWMLRGAEVGVIVAMGLAACAWPGAGFFRTANTNLVMPAVHELRSPNWQATQAMAYVPGRADMLASGHVRDWPAFIARLAAAGRDTDQQDPVAKALWQRLDKASRVRFLMADRTPEDAHPSDLTTALNEAIQGQPWIMPSDLPPSLVSEPMRPLIPLASSGTLTDNQVAAYNRLLLSSAMPDLVMPPPRGDGLLFMNGRYDGTLTEQLVIGGLNMGEAQVGLSRVPWGSWWPTIRLWWAAALLMGMAVLCMAIIVHPQWAHRELLAYPIPRFFDEMLRRPEGQLLPTVTASKLFWIGAVAMICLHTINFAGQWFPALPTVPRQFNLTGLLGAFPESWASIVYLLRGYIYFTVVALAFFLNRSISFSVGISPLAYTALTAFMFERGLNVQSEYLGAGRGNMLRFGAYVAVAGFVLYLGRHYYLNVLRGAIGLRCAAGVSRSGIWSARLLAVASGAFVLCMDQVGLSMPFAAMLWALVLLTFLVLSRIVAETGMFFIQPYWMPVGVLTAMLGFESIGPSTYIIMAVASTMLVGDVRTALMANIVNGLRVADGQRTTSLPRLLPWIAIMIVVGFFVAAGATLWTQYNHGLLNTNGFTQNQLPSIPFDGLSKYLTESDADGTLSAATAGDGKLSVSLMHSREGAWSWLVIGFVLVAGCAWARTRFPWWPLHPVIFLLWGTFPVNVYAFSFLVGWIVKSVAMKLGGQKACRLITPLMIGLVAGEMFFSFASIGIDAAYYYQTGLAPPRYSVFQPS